MDRRSFFGFLAGAVATPISLKAGLLTTAGTVNDVIPCVDWARLTSGETFTIAGIQDKNGVPQVFRTVGWTSGNCHVSPM